ncbi:MAG: hypothetical protein ABL895_01155 [Cyclobacteriaceae bacterium]
MKHLVSIIFLALFIVSALGQSKVTPVKRSELSGIELPAGAKQDKRILATASAKTLLDMIAKDNQIILEDAVEVFTLTGTVGSGTFDQVKSSAQKAGWQLTSISGQTKYWQLKKNTTTLLMYLESNKRDTQLYLSAVKSVNTQPEITIPPATTNNASATQSNKQPNSIPEITTQKENTEQKTVTVPAPTSGFAFTTTNFDDGWVSIVQEDWVQVTKGNTRVLIHYPNKNADTYNSVLMDGLKNAWNILVAPKYSSASNFEFKPINSWQSIEFAEADAVEKTTGKSVHVVLFKMNYSNGSGRYLEFITPDKKTFEQEFGAYHETSYGWENVEKMANYNKFAVAASDLTGKWTNNFSGTQQYVNAYTGASAGMDTHSSNQNFEFGPQNTYKWDLSVASGFVGSIKFQNVKSTGQFSLPNNWQINFSDLEGKPKTYNAYFSCAKGVRILWLEDTAYPTGYTGYGKVE